MKTIKIFALMLCIAAAGLATGCSKDNDSNNGNGGSDYSVTPTSLVGTKWSATGTDNGVQVYVSLSFSSSSQVVLTERYGAEEEAVNATYVYHSPQGTIYYTWDSDSYEVNFTVDGPVMRIGLPGNPNAVLTRE